MSTAPERAFFGSGVPSGRRSRRALIATGAALIALLIFSTSTVFVQEAWAIESFQIGVFALTAAYLLYGIRRGRHNLASGVAPWLIYLIPVWGVVQILAHTTASTFETREAVLRWGALAAVFFLTQIVGGTSRAREIMLLAFLSFATLMAVLCMTQLFTSEGRVLWIFPSGFGSVYATFPYRNNYTQFIEVSLPIALWWALRDGWRGWGYALAGGILYASVIGTASRAGAVICTAELLTTLTIGLILHRRAQPRRLFRSAAATFVMVPLLAAIFTFVVGWQRTWQRFQNGEPFGARRQFMLSAVDMVKHRPLTGYGLDTFPEVYQQHAVMDFPFYANHAHNDWAEFAADGGVPFFLLVLIPFATAVPTAIRHPWGLGLIAVMLNACFDYPFPRPAVSGWMFAMLALLYMARTADRRSRESAKSPGTDPSHHILSFKREKGDSTERAV
jgi:O-antigen ligase